MRDKLDIDEMGWYLLYAEYASRRAVLFKRHRETRTRTPKMFDRKPFKRPTHRAQASE